MLNLWRFSDFSQIPKGTKNSSVGERQHGKGGVPTLPTSAAIGMGIYLFAGGLKIVTLIKV